MNTTTNPNRNEAQWAINRTACALMALGNVWKSKDTRASTKQNI